MTTLSSSIAIRPRRQAAPEAVVAPAEANAQAPLRPRSRDGYLYALLIALTFGAWLFCRQGYFKAGDDVGYWLGVAGGVTMLLLFSYPLRKYVRFTHRWGKVKWWFVVHMVLGIGGPLLILLHSTFKLGSVNGAVALFSMIIVAVSGVLGRFIYLRIHRGLHGNKGNLADMQRKAGLAEGEMKLRFRFAPEVAQQLLAFEAAALKPDPSWAAMLSRVVLLPIRQRRVYNSCARDLSERLRAIAVERHWGKKNFRRRRSQAQALARVYLASVVRVAQFTAYERLFALWHVLHTPFVYLLVITAGFHVFAVHAY
jgi:hypothetical protein